MSNKMQIADAMWKPAPDAVQLKGLIGQRFENSRKNRLIHQEEDHLLWPFQLHCPVGWHPENMPRPGLRGDWHGEFLGTWVDAAVLSAWNAADESLRQKVERMVADWLATQTADGYLGTYDEADRWKSWDVWVQAHNLIGLLSFYRFTGRKEILEAALRIADRVLQDFGPGKRSLRETGPHVGMASSAFLEPLIWLYRETGEERYLAFALWLVESDWEGEGGPQIISALLSGKGVAGTANSKGIEMLIDFAGLLELYRATGEARYLQTILTAWEDIVSHHLYITGSASTGEYFPKDFGLRNEGIDMIGETCVSMGWLYLNLSLGRLTGDARYFDMAEQTLYNHLMAAQSADGRLWIYYLGLRDSKRFCWHTDPECCPSRGVRAIAQMPTHAFTLFTDGIALNFYDAAEAALPLSSGRQVRVQVETAYPMDRKVRLALDLDQAETFTLRLRLPGWCREYALALNGQALEVKPDGLGYLALRREWAAGDALELALEMPARVVADTLGNSGRCAVTRGPLVYAADAAYLPEGLLLDDVVLALDEKDSGFCLRELPARGETVHLAVSRAVLHAPTGAGFWRENERYHDLAGKAQERMDGEIELVPFFEAGNLKAFEFPDGIRSNMEAVRAIHFAVWLPYTWKA